MDLVKYIAAQIPLAEEEKLLLKEHIIVNEYSHKEIILLPENYS